MSVVIGKRQTISLTGPRNKGGERKACHRQLFNGPAENSKTATPASSVSFKLSSINDDTCK